MTRDWPVYVVQVLIGLRSVFRFGTLQHFLDELFIHNPKITCVTYIITEGVEASI
jgi:hypothetical protein